ncbi:MAG TPA: glycosyltransferase family 4 protein [Vicinamibacterales bacterium]|jgi:phosphatidylinositol alpha-1,6-mannosyltransferase|nr:glycosyltransferase family 4 protein [Vicinamibacterales bacterium]
MITDTRNGRPGVAAVTFDPRGGGIAAVSRLVAGALTTADGQPPVQLSLALDAGDGRFDSSTLDRLRFGARVLAAQATGACEWLLFTHLSLATAQRFVPAICRRPYAVFLHDVEAWQTQPPARRRVLDRAFLRLANSTYTARRVLEANPGVGDVIACPLALGPDWTSRASTEVARAQPPRPHVLIVGRMIASERYKGHDQLLAAWPRVRQRVPAAKLICVGEGDDVERLRSAARKIGVGDAVEFTGFVSDEERWRLYREAAVFAMPSRREGFGLVYLEAMAAGLPCIGSIHDAASEVIVDGRTGWLVDQSDTNALADRIVHLLSDEPERAAMGDAGRRRFLAQFTFDAFQSRLTSALASSAPAGQGVSLGVRPQGL